MKHAIFALSSSHSELKKDSFDFIPGNGDKKAIYSREFDGRMSMASIQDDETIYVDQLQGRSGACGAMTSEVKNIRNPEEFSPAVASGDGSPESRDLARNGLPSACVFVAKFEPLFPMETSANTWAQSCRKPGR